MKRKSDSSLAYVKRSRKVSSKLRYSKVSFGTLQRSLIIDIPITNGASPVYGFSFSAAGVYNNGTLSSFPGGTDIGNAYDAYRIMKVKACFIYNQNNSNVNQYGETLPYITTAVDQDSDGIPSGISSLLQRDNCITANFGEGGGLRHTRIFVPKVAATVYGGSVNLGYMEPKAYQWVSTAVLGSTGDARHYGLLTVIENQNQTILTGTNGNLRCFFTVYFETKHGQ